jgi:hypothetical protein
MVQVILMILVGRLHSHLVALHEELQREVEMMESSNEMLVGLHKDLKLRNYLEMLQVP